jgi:hypothetical protein
MRIGGPTQTNGPFGSTTAHQIGQHAAGVPVNNYTHKRRVDVRLLRSGLLAGVAVTALVVTACTSTSPEPGASEGPSGDMRTISAVAADITVDGDASDWEGIDGLTLSLEAIADEEVEAHDASVKVAHDDEFIYVLFEVTDDYDYVAGDDYHLSGSSAIQWAIDTGAGEHMGADEPDRETSLGVVDIWHWELECGPGVENGGAVSEPGAESDPGDDGACNFDDEWAEVPETREDDNGTGAENSLLGVWNHTNPTTGEDGTWIWEIRRPLQTGDEQDAQFSVGEAALLALAYWDPDVSPEGWSDEGHVQSANQGWIQVQFE